ncbi:ATP-dependent DNA helicase [Trichonephila clavipes]|nr:ATP-dependent DNA helicase [Trichonephila clavipes]
MVNRLYLNVDDDYCVNVHIKRKKIHRTSYLVGLFTKRTMKPGLQYLVATPLYRMYDVTIDDSFFNLNQSTSQIPQNEISENILLERVLQPSNRRCYGVKRNIFLSVLEKRMYQEACCLMNMPRKLSFPAIYLGHFRNFKEGVRVTPFMIATSEIRRVERRGVTPQHLLYMAMKIMRVRDSHLPDTANLLFLFWKHDDVEN